MKKWFLTFTFLTLFQSIGIAQTGEKIDRIRIPNSYGQMIDATKNVDRALIIVFTNHQCKFAQLYTERLKKIDSTYRTKGISLIAIESKVESFEASTSSLQQFIKEENIGFQYLIDLDNSLATQFKAQSSPHTFLLKRNGTQFEIIYSGSIDNNSRKPEKATQQYLINALEGFLANEKIKTSSTKVIGCTIDKSTN